MGKICETGRFMKQAIKVVKENNWIIRADNNGESHNGFRWKGRGRWTVAHDWSPDGSCGCGLHGQDVKHGGFIKGGTRLLFCKTDGVHFPIHDDKVKVQKAMILLVNELPPNLKIIGDLNLNDMPLSQLPDGLSVGGSLDLQGTSISQLPDGLSVGGYLDLRGTSIKREDVPKHIRNKARF